MNHKHLSSCFCTWMPQGVKLEVLYICAVLINTAYLNNVTVNSGAKLILKATGEVIANEIDIQLSAEYEIKK